METKNRGSGEEKRRALFDRVRSYDPQEAEIETYKTAGKWTIRINDDIMTVKELAEYLGQRTYNVRFLFSRGAKKDPGLANHRIRDYLWRLKRGVPQNTKIYKRGGEWYILDDIIEATGLDRTTAYREVRNWENGLISTKELFYTKKERQEAINRRMKEKTGSNIPYHDPRTQKIRQENLRKIPGPTEIEKRLWGLT